MNFINSLRLQPEKTPLVQTAAVMTVVLAVMFPVGTVGMALHLLPRHYQWTTSVYLGVQAALTFLVLWASTTPMRALAITIGIALGATTIEFIGLATGVPFGTYYYSYRLEPFVVSNVPLAIVFAWYILVVNCVVLSRTSAVRRHKSPTGMAMQIAAGGIFILGIDIMLEPFASFINRYWTWSDAAVPLQNYAAWWAVGTIFIAFTHWMITAGTVGDRDPSANIGAAHVSWLPELILGLTILQCSVINVLNGYWIETLTGLGLCAAAYWRLRNA
jgi:bisanhydrobacterioruberin hydratase